MDKITPRQKEIVIEQWKTVRANPKKYGPLLFVKVFEMFPEYRSYFIKSGFGNVPLEDLPNDKILLGHGTFVIYALNSLLDNLDEPDVMLSLLQKIGKSHGAKGITSDPFKNVPCIVVAFMKDICGGLDKESEEAWTVCMEAACTLISSHLGN